MGLPSWSQLTSCTGWPETMHWNCASLSTSTVCTCGCRCAVNGAGALRAGEMKWERECWFISKYRWWRCSLSNHVYSVQSRVSALTCHRERHLNSLLARRIVYPAQIFATVLETRLQWHKSMAITIFGFHFHADNWWPSKWTKGIDGGCRAGREGRGRNVPWWFWADPRIQW